MVDETWRVRPPLSRRPKVGDIVQIWWGSENRFLAGHIVRAHDVVASPTSSTVSMSFSVRYHQKYLPLNWLKANGFPSTAQTQTLDFRHDFAHERVKFLGPKHKVFKDIRNLQRSAIKVHKAASPKVPFVETVDAKRQRKTVTPSRGRRRSARPTEHMRSLLDEVFSRVLLRSKHTLRCLATPVNKAQFPDYCEKVRCESTTVPTYLCWQHIVVHYFKILADSQPN